MTRRTPAANYPFPSPLGEGRGEAYKYLRNGLLFIERNGKIYTITGAETR